MKANLKPALNNGTLLFQNSHNYICIQDSYFQVIPYKFFLLKHAFLESMNL